jgi:dTDP-4-amino-4,6-dideoxygalactose transaminase
LTPVFADVDPMSFNMTADSLKRVITREARWPWCRRTWGLPC